MQLGGRPSSASATKAFPQHQRDALGYLPAIDGLRAVAVLSVLLFHLDPVLLPGGYCGVDVFFVVSGFVVTRASVDLRFLRFRDALAHFYARRLLRIAPGLVVMLFATTLAYDLFVPDAWLSQGSENVGKAAFLGLSNVRLMLDYDSYFGPAADFDPFVHTWSLGVEEQFYLAFPFLVFWHQRRPSPSRRRAVAAAAALASAVSLALCAAATPHHQRVAFYSIPTRFWELGAGMLLCLTLPAWCPRLAAWRAGLVTALGCSGAATLALAACLPAGPLFPFPLAVLPVAATAALVAVTTACPAGGLFRLLSSGPARLLGRLSYSVYLWHWPVFSLFRWTVGLGGLARDAAALACVAALSAACYRWVEAPARRSRGLARLPRPGVALGSLAAVLVAWWAGIALFAAKPALSLSRTADRAAWYAIEADDAPARGSCKVRRSGRRLDDGHAYSWDPAQCPDAAAGPRLYVAGDSHSLVYYQAFRWLAEDGVSVRAYNKTGCGVLTMLGPSASDPDCATFVSRSFDDMAADARPGDLVFLPSLRLPRFADQWGGVAEPAPTAAEREAAVAETVSVAARLDALGLRLVFEAPTPIFRSPAFRCADWYDRVNPICAGGLEIARDEVVALRRPFYDAMRRVVAAAPHAAIWDPLPYLCPGNTCQAISAAGPLFFDGDHLSGLGVALVSHSLSDLVRPGSVERP